MDKKLPLFIVFLFSFIVFSSPVFAGQNDMGVAWNIPINTTYYNVTLNSTVEVSTAAEGCMGQMDLGTNISMTNSTSDNKTFNYVFTDMYDGAHSLIVYCAENATVGTWNFSQMNFTHDTFNFTFPVVNTSHISAQWTYINITTINATNVSMQVENTTDSSGVIFMINSSFTPCSNDNSCFWYYNVSNVTAASSPILLDSLHNITVWVNATTEEDASAANQSKGYWQFTVDTTNPTLAAFDTRFLTDGKLNVSWTYTETNGDYCGVRVYSESNGTYVSSYNLVHFNGTINTSTTSCQVNVTGTGEFNGSSISLHDGIILLEGYLEDSAGNMGNSSNITNITFMKLYDGWNIVGIMTNNTNTSDIADYHDDIDYVSWYNNTITNKTLLTWNDDSDTGDTVNVTWPEAIWISVTADSDLFQNISDRRTFAYAKNTFNYTVSSPWTLMTFSNYTYLFSDQIDYVVKNDSGTDGVQWKFMTYVNQSKTTGSKYITYRDDWNTTGNPQNTRLWTGLGVWLALNATSTTFEYNITIEWGVST